MLFGKISYPILCLMHQWLAVLTCFPQVDHWTFYEEWAWSHVAMVYKFIISPVQCIQWSEPLKWIVPIWVYLVDRSYYSWSWGFIQYFEFSISLSPKLSSTRIILFSFIHSNLVQQVPCAFLPRLYKWNPAPGLHLYLCRELTISF